MILKFLVLAQIFAAVRFNKTKKFSYRPIKQFTQFIYLPTFVSSNQVG